MMVSLYRCSSFVFVAIAEMQEERPVGSMVGDFLREAETKQLRGMEKKYNFDFGAERPLQKGKWEWEKQQ